MTLELILLKIMQRCHFVWQEEAARPRVWREERGKAEMIVQMTKTGSSGFPQTVRSV